MTSELKNRLFAHEGAKRYVYKDTNGFYTIGVGRNIDSRCGRGLTKEEQEYLLNNDIELCRKQLSLYPFYSDLDVVRQEVLIEMAFNMGIASLLKFTKLIHALLDHDFHTSCVEMLNSRWAKQIGSDRLNDLLRRMETGSYAKTS